MKKMTILLMSACWMMGCESKPQEATEVPEDLMREIAMEAARDMMKIDGPGIVMIEAGDQIQQLARQTASTTARQVAADECRILLEKVQIQKLELRVQELEYQVHQLKAELAKERSIPEPPK